jgi:electron transfer flavoprotein beta subunit
MTNIVVLVKQVPDTYSERKLSGADHTLDRESADAVLDEINEKAVEEALKIKEAGEGEVTVISVGPARATDAIRKALSMGADKAIHVSDEALHGSDAIATAKVIAAAIGKVEGYDLIIAGNESSDGRGGAVPAILAELLGLPQVTYAREVTVDGTTIKATRETEDGLTHLEANLPAVVSVGEKINEPRYPSFKGIMAAKKKPVQTWSLADLGLDASLVGLGAAWTKVESFTKRPPRAQGQIVTDEGEGGTKLAEFLTSHKFV